MKKYLSLALLIVVSNLFSVPELPPMSLLQPADRRPGHEHDDAILAAGFCEILLHGAAALAAKDDREAQMKEAAIVAASIISLLQLASRSLPHEETARALERMVALEKLENMLNNMLKNPEFLQALGK